MPEDTLTIKIDTNNNPVDLSSFGKSLTALHDLYSTLYPSKEAIITIKEIRKGSIEIDLVSLGVMILPLVANTNTVVQFVRYIKSFLELLKNNSSESDNLRKKYGLPKENTESVKNLKSVLGTLNMSGSTFNNCPMTLIINNKPEEVITERDIKTVQHNADKYISNNKKEDITDSLIKEKQAFTWNQANFKSKNKGNRGIIENIDSKAKNILFTDDSTKEYMTTGNNWQKKIYYVDVEVQRANGKLVSYKVIKHYPEETIDPMSED